MVVIGLLSLRYTRERIPAERVESREQLKARPRDTSSDTTSVGESRVRPFRPRGRSSSRGLRGV